MDFLLKFLFSFMVVTGICNMAYAGYKMQPTVEDKKWLILDLPPFPEGNQPTPERVELGKMLYFDPRLSGDGITSCATCHNPGLGWTDGRAKGVGFKGKELDRASPTLINAAYSSLQMWDGRIKNLEDQVTAPMISPDEMHTDMQVMEKWLNTSSEYKILFSKAYPGEAIDRATVAKAIASFERTILSTNSAFDRWLKGNAKAMTEQQIRGFRLFEDPTKGNCAICHSAPNFADDGFHNIGLKSFDAPNADPGRFAIKAVPSLKGAFKTPTLRDVAMTAPYFHDGSATTLKEVIEHYNRGGDSKKNLSPNIKSLNLSDKEIMDIVAFMAALTAPQLQVTLPILPVL
ncbi:MAG: cytochrome c peroxidase [Pseudomonadota bacterium]